MKLVKTFCSAFFRVITLHIRKYLTKCIVAWYLWRSRSKFAWHTKLYKVYFYWSQTHFYFVFGLFVPFHDHLNMCSKSSDQTNAQFLIRNKKAVIQAIALLQSQTIIEAPQDNDHAKTSSWTSSVKIYLFAPQSFIFHDFIWFFRSFSFTLRSMTLFRSKWFWLHNVLQARHLGVWLEIWYLASANNFKTSFIYVNT